MKFKIFGRQIEITNTASLPPPHDDAAWSEFLTRRGYHVSASTAIKVAAVIRCVDVIAKTVASLPLNLYRKTETGREKATDHPLYKILYRLPNPETTAYEFWHMYIFNLLLTIGAFAKISRDRNGYIRALWNIPTANTSKIKRNSINGERYIDVYSTAPDGRAITERLREGEFMYTPGLRFGSIDNPEDPIRIAAEVLGLTKALNDFAIDFFKNGTNLGGVVEMQGAMSDDAYKRFKESWQEAYSGVLNQHKTAILEDGGKFNKIEPKLSEAQALESRKFAIVEICRIFGVPPHKAYELDRATFSNIEHMNTEFVQESIGPMDVRLEQTIFKDLLITGEQELYYAKFNENALLRGDTEARTNYYHSMRNDGVFNADEIRELEDMNDQPDGLGKIYFINGNMLSVEHAKDNLPKSLQGSAK